MSSLTNYTTAYTTVALTATTGGQYPYWTATVRASTFTGIASGAQLISVSAAPTSNVERSHAEYYVEYFDGSQAQISAYPKDVLAEVLPLDAVHAMVSAGFATPV